MNEYEQRRRIVLGVTSKQSLRLLEGFPEYLSANGWDVHVVSGVGMPVSSSPDVTHHELPMERDPSPARDVVSLVRWIRMMARLRPDVIVAGTPKAGLLGTIAGAVTRVPVRVYMLRGLRLESESGYRRSIFALIERVTSMSATHVQSVSSSLTDAFVGMRLAPRQKVAVVGSGSSNGVRVDVEPLGPGDACGINRPFRVGFVGRVTEHKGVDTLLNAVSLVAARGTPIEVVIAGDEEPPGYLDSAISRSGVPRDRVTRLGHVHDPATAYRRVDALCLPSHREGFPNVVLEAAVHGIPTIASAVTGCVDAVVDGKTGGLVPVRDPRALADLLQEWADDRKLVRRLGENARERAVLNFDRRQVWRSTEQYYAALLTVGKKRSWLL